MWIVDNCLYKNHHRFLSFPRKGAFILRILQLLDEWKGSITISSMFTCPLIIEHI